jgi:hypothetical protein
MLMPFRSRAGWQSLAIFAVSLLQMVIHVVDALLPSGMSGRKSHYRTYMMNPDFTLCGGLRSGLLLFLLFLLALWHPGSQQVTGLRGSASDA